MKYELKKSTLNQPLASFEEMYSKQGQLILKGAFLARYYPVPYYDPDIDVDIEYHKIDFDLENEPLYMDFGGHNPETGVYESAFEEYKYVDFILSKFKLHYYESCRLFLERIDSCNSLEDQFFVLRSIKRKIEKMKMFVSQNTSIPFRTKQVKWISKLQSAIHEIYEENTGFISFDNQKVTPDEVKSILTKLYQNEETEITDDHNDIVKIQYFLFSSDLNQDFGKIKYKCSAYALRNIIMKFQALGLLPFSWAKIAETKFFWKRVPTSGPGFDNAKCQNADKKKKVHSAIETAFSKK